jgi:hypothetical protein
MRLPRLDMTDDFPNRFSRTRRSARADSRLSERFLSYLKTRRPEHWAFFVAGVVVGMLLH